MSELLRVIRRREGNTVAVLEGEIGTSRHRVLEERRPQRTAVRDTEYHSQRRHRVLEKTLLLM